MTKSKITEVLSETLTANNPVCFEETKIQCTFCLAQFKVIYFFQPGNNTEQSVYCPECKEEHIVQASSPIMESAVELILPRMDARIVMQHSER